MRIHLHAFFVGAARGEQPVGDIPITGKSIEALDGLDEAILRLIAKHDLPGISIAISDDGRLIHSRGYGYSDREAAEPVSPSSRCSDRCNGPKIMKSLFKAKFSRRYKLNR